MNEDDTFRRLARTPYLEMVKLYDNFWTRHHNDTVSLSCIKEKKLLFDNGWTYSELMDAILKYGR